MSLNEQVDTPMLCNFIFHTRSVSWRSSELAVAVSDCWCSISQNDHIEAHCEKSTNIGHSFVGGKHFFESVQLLTIYTPSRDRIRWLRENYERGEGGTRRKLAPRRTPPTKSNYNSSRPP